MSKKTFKIFGATEEVKEDIYFKLVNESNADSDAILLIACDKNGTRLSAGNILQISDKGIHLCTCVSEKLGLPLVNRKVKVY